jgi:hypothetical protein
LIVDHLIWVLGVANSVPLEPVEKAFPERGGKRRFVADGVVAEANEMSTLCGLGKGISRVGGVGWEVGEVFWRPPLVAASEVEISASVDRAVDHGGAAHVAAEDRPPFHCWPVWFR